ncbi:MAG: LD-carboxypeptidase, partial [Myxococcota bacterium]|nr:LD-carboxypeptidase [Myxococcota bacterium]
APDAGRRRARAEQRGSWAQARGGHYGRPAAAYNRVMLPAVSLAALTWLLPPVLSPGDLVAVVAPSSPLSGAELWPGLAWLRARYRIRMGSGVLAHDGFLAGDDRRRAFELSQAIGDREVKAIVAARGGYGALRLLDQIPWEALSRHPKWIVGFSDVTALHAMAWRAGVASIHAPNVAGLGGASVAVRAAWLTALERSPAKREWPALRVLHRGHARSDAAGRLVGGNLSLVHALAAAGRLTVPAGAVLALEDVGEAPYRVDRMFTSLLLGGHLARLSAIVLGGFDRSPPGVDGRSVDDVLQERTRGLGIPVLAGAPFGHGTNNAAFLLGTVVHVRNDTIVWG